MPEPSTMLNPEDKAAKTLPGTVEKVIKPFVPGQPEKVQIGLETEEHLYREIRVENTLTNADGEKVALKEGAEVEVTIAADEKDTVKKKDSAS